MQTHQIVLLICVGLGMFAVIGELSLLAHYYNGVPMKQIQICLGHSTFSATADIYAHLDVSAQVETGDVAGSFFIKSNPAEPLALSESPMISTQQMEDIPQTLMAPTFAG